MILQTEHAALNITAHEDYFLISYMGAIIRCSKDSLLFYFTAKAEDDGEPYLSLEVNGRTENFNVCIAINADQITLIQAHETLCGLINT